MKRQFIGWMVNAVVALVFAGVMQAQDPVVPQAARPETKPWNLAGDVPVSQLRLDSAPPLPPLFLREPWKMPSADPRATNLDHCCWPLTQETVASPNLELHLYGAVKDIVMSLGKNGMDYPEHIHVFTGMCTTACAVALSDKKNYVDLTRGKIRWDIKTMSFHNVRPILKLADGTYLIGDFAASTNDGDWREFEFYPSEIRWLRMDSDRVTAYGEWITKPDLSKVDEVGWADLLAGSGHNGGSYDDVAAMEVYGYPVPRESSAKSH